MKRRTNMWALFAALTLTPCGLAAEQAAAAEQAPEEATSGITEERFERMQQNLWWNRQDMIELLGLSESQRQEMNGFARDYVVALPGTGRTMRALQKSFNETLATGTKEEAESLANQLGDLMSAQYAGQAMMKVRVLFVLTEQQRKTMAAEKASFFNQPWMRQMRSGVARDGRQGH